MTEQFSFFSRLPGELRNQIWDYALPNLDAGPFLYKYETGCWQPRYFTPVDEAYEIYDRKINETLEEYNLRQREGNLNIEFRYNLLDNMKFELQMLSVNREARSFTLAWMQKYNIALYSYNWERQYPIYKPLGNRNRDALYAEEDSWEDFLSEVTLRIDEPDLVGRTLGSVCYLKRIALTEDLVRNHRIDLPSILVDFQIEWIYILFGLPRPSSKHLKPQQVWKLRDTKGDLFCWNEYSSDYKGDKDVSDLVNETKRIIYNDTSYRGEEIQFLPLFACNR